MSRFKCDYCKRRSTKAAMLKHEKRCFRNPDRYCDYCENKGTIELQEDIYYYDAPCHCCNSRDPEKEKAIAAYEAGLKPQSVIQDTEAPF